MASNNTAGIAQARKLVEQLKMEANVDRMKVRRHVFTPQVVVCHFRCNLRHSRCSCEVRRETLTARESSQCGFFLQMLARRHTADNICGGACTTQGATPSHSAHLLIEVKPCVRLDRLYFFFPALPNRKSGRFPRRTSVMQGVRHLLPPHSQRSEDADWFA